MKTVFSCCLTFLLPLALLAQKPIPAFGEDTDADLKLTSCSFEPDATAMKLFDIQEVEYEPSAFGGKIRTEKRVRLKIFNEKGYQHATITIPYYSNKKNTKIEDLKGIIYSPDGRGNIITSKLEEADFFKEKAMEKIGLIRFTFPNLKPGSVIEYSYVLTEKNRLQIDNWYIQSDLPCAYSAMTVVVPTFSKVKEVTMGSGSVQNKEELLTKGLDKTKKIFYKENIASFRPEPHMSSFNDNILRMGFVLLQDNRGMINDMSPQSIWRVGVNMILRSSFYTDLFTKPIPGTDKYMDTAKSYADPLDKMKYLYQTVKKRIPEKQGQALFPEDIADAWKSRTGTSAEINFLLMNLLTRAGVTCYPLFVSTREHGKVNPDFPSFGQFNGVDVLVKANGHQYLLDATLKHQSYNIPPINILNRQAFLFNPDNLQWVMVTDDRPLLKQTTDIFASLTPEGKMEGGATISYYDYAKSVLFDTTASTDDNKSHRFFDKKMPGLKILTDNKVSSENEEPSMQTIEFDYETNNTGDFYFINPQLFSSGKINPFTRPTRVTDIDFGCNQEIRLTMQLDIPANFKVEELPKNIVLRSPDSSFIFTRIISATKSKISVAQVMEIKKATFDKNEYAALFDFFNQVQKVIGEEIMLKKAAKP